MLMTCRHVAQLRDTFLDGELSPSLIAEIHAHLLQCPACQEQFEMFRVGGEIIAKDQSEPKLDSDFASRVITQLPMTTSGTLSFGPQTWRQRRQRFWRNVLSRGLPAAAAVLFIGILMWPTRKESGPYGEVAGVSMNATEASGVNDVVTPTLDAVVETQRAARSLHQILKLSVEQARQDVDMSVKQSTPPRHDSFLDLFLDPFRDVLQPVEDRTSSSKADDGLVRF